MRILLADALPRGPIDRLAASGAEVVAAPELTADDLPAHMDGVEVLVVRSTPVHAATIDAGDHLGLIVRAGAGTNTIDTAHAAARGVFVSNVPGRNAVAVAELTIGLLVAVDRGIAAASGELQGGIWNKRAHTGGRGLAGRRLAVTGLGDIGLAVARRARGFEMDVAVLDRPDRADRTVDAIDELGIEVMPDRRSLLAGAYAVSIHVPAAAATRLMVDAEFLAEMDDGAVLLNTSRGDVVDEQALRAELDAGRLRAGLDVFDGEPSGSGVEFSSPLAGHPAVVATPHIGASTRQAQQAVADGVVEIIEAYRRGSVLHCVNLESSPPRAATLTVRHLDRVGVLASVLEVLRRAELNVTTMQNRVFDGQVAAAASISVGTTPDQRTVDAVRDLPDVLSVSVSGPEGSE